MSTENLKVVITGDASDLDKAGAEAQKALDGVSKSAAEWDKRARELNLQMNYTDRGLQKIGTTAARIPPVANHVEQGFRRISGATNQANFAMISLAQGIGDIPYGFTAIANNIQQTIQGFIYLQRTTGGTGKALKALGATLTGPTGLFLAVSVVTAAITYFSNKSSKAKEETDKWADKLKNLRDGLKSVSDVQGITIQNTAKQAAELNLLYNAATDTTRSQKERLKAAKDLQTAFPKTFSNLSQLKIISGEAASAFNSLSENILKVGKAQAILDQIVDNYKNIGKATQDIDKMRSKQTQLFQDLQKEQAKLKTYGTLSQVLTSGSQALINEYQKQIGKINQARNALNDYTKKMEDAGKIIQEAIANNKQLQDSFNATDFKVKPGTSGSDKSIKTIADIMAQLKSDFAATDTLAKGLGLSLEQIGTAKIDALYKAIENIAKVGGPEAVAQIKKLAEEANGIQASSFLPTLSGGRAQVNAPSGIGNINVPTTVQGQPGNFGTSKDTIKLLNEQFRDTVKTGRELESVFEGVFSSIANGTNPFQALIQVIEQLIIKLLAAAAAAAVLNALTGGGAAGFGAIFGQLSGLKGLIPSHAQGGYIPGPQLAIVGDAPGGEWVLNQRQISAILNGSGGGRNIEVTGRIEAEGSTLQVILDNANKKTNRRN